MVGEKSNYDRVQQTPEDGIAAVPVLAVIGWPSDGGARPWRSALPLQGPGFLLNRLSLYIPLYLFLLFFCFKTFPFAVDHF